jgi:hypothetical protein
MDYKKLGLSIVFLLAIVGLSKIEFLDDVVASGNDLEVFTSVLNSGADDQDDVRVITYFPELGLSVNSQRFDVQDNDNVWQLMWWDVPSNIPKGDYLVRVAASNDNFRSHKYRYITVE